MSNTKMWSIEKSIWNGYIFQTNYLCKTYTSGSVKSEFERSFSILEPEDTKIIANSFKTKLLTIKCIELGSRLQKHNLKGKLSRTLWEHSLKLSTASLSSPDWLLWPKRPQQKLPFKFSTHSTRRAGLSSLEFLEHFFPKSWLINRTAQG